MCAYGPADATTSQNPIKALISAASFKSRMVLPFWYRLTQVVAAAAVVVVKSAIPHDECRRRGGVAHLPSLGLETAGG